MNLISNDELYHHGVKGQRWGERNYQYEDGSLTPEGKARYAKNYKASQRAQDEVHYGRGGMERINKSMRDRGYNVSTARSIEAKRINDARKRTTTLRAVGRTAGSFAGLAAGYALSKKIVDTMGIDDPVTKIAVQAVTNVGATRVGSALGEYGGTAVGMLSAGYSPSKWRYASS